MRRIEIEVSDTDYQRAKDLLENLKYVKVIRDKDVEEQRERIDLTSGRYNKIHESLDETHVPGVVDEVTLMSQPSLAEEWDNEEDSVWDQYFEDTKPTGESISQL